MPDLRPATWAWRHHLARRKLEDFSALHAGKTAFRPNGGSGPKWRRLADIPGRLDGQPLPGQRFVERENRQQAVGFEIGGPNRRFEWPPALTVNDLRNPAPAGFLLSGARQKGNSVQPRELLAGPRKWPFLDPREKSTTMARSAQKNKPAAQRDVVYGWSNIYDLTEFIRAYDLPLLEARPLFQQYGPSRQALNAAMKARHSCS